MLINDTDYPVLPATIDSLRARVFDSPIVRNGYVQVDVRGVYMVAIVGVNARQIPTWDDFVMFLAEVVPVYGWEL